MRTTALLSISLLVFGGTPLTADAQVKTATFRLEATTLRASLDSLMRWYSVSIVYLDSDVEGISISASCRDCGLEESLNRVLAETRLTWMRIANQVVLKQRPVRQDRPSGTVSGLVNDSLTGEWIAGAHVAVRGLPRQMCSTNAYGFYAIRRIPAGSYMVSVRAVGYVPMEVPVTVEADGALRIDMSMRQQEIALQEVTVEGTRTALRSTEGFTRGVYIRSTPSDQNEYLLDGARIYNPSHFGGVLSTFNAEALNDVQVLVGGLPPFYGGRIGGILDLSMRDGSRERLTGTVGTTSLGSSLSIEGPLGEATTFLLSGRRGYPDNLLPIPESQGTRSRLGTSELSAKLSHVLSGSNWLYLTGYAANDVYDNHASGPVGGLSNHFRWDNRTLNLRWIGIPSPSVFLYASAVYTGYDFGLSHTLADSSPGVTSYRSDYRVDDVTLRAHAEHYYDGDHTVRGGVELVRHGLKGSISEFSTQIAPVALTGSPLWELSVYLQDQWRILPGVLAEFGARATSFTGGEGSFSSVDPRFSLLVTLNEETRVYGSLTSISQFLHPYRNSGVFLFYPPIFWYPSTEKARPATSLQVTVGLERESDASLVSVESFYRTTQNLHEVVLKNPDPVVTEFRDALIMGAGRSYGLEVSLRKRTGELTGAVTYTVQWASHKFPELYGGESFSPRFDRRHELQASGWYAPWEGWAFGALCVVASNTTPSLAPTSSVESAPVFSERSMVDLNGGRLPGFQRLELSAVRKFQIGTFSCQVTARLVNAYGLIDPFVWTLRQSPDARLKWMGSMKELPLLPLFPAIGLLVRW